MGDRMPSEGFDERLAALVRAYGDGAVRAFDPTDIARTAIEAGATAGGLSGALRLGTARLERRAVRTLFPGARMTPALAIGAIAIVVLILVGAYVLSKPMANVGGPEPSVPAMSPSLSSTPSSLPIARNVRPEATITLDSSVGEITAGPDAIWVGTAAGIVRIEPTTNIAEQTSVGAGWLLAVAGDDVWVVGDGNVVNRIGWTARRQTASIPVDAGPEGVIFSDGSVWVASNETGSVNRIDPATNTVVDMIQPGEGGNAQRVAAGLGSIWVGEADGSLVVRIDPKTKQITARIAIEGSVPCGDFAIEPTVVWVAGCGGGHPTIATIDPTTNRWITTVVLPGDPRGQAMLIDGLLWVPIAGDGEGCCIVAVDPSTNTVVDAIAIDGAPAGDAVVAFGSVWVNQGEAAGGIPQAEGARVVRLPLDAFHRGGG